MIKIEKLTEARLDALTELENKCFSVPWSRESFAGTIGNKNAYFIVADKDGELAGYAGMYHVLDEGDIANVAVDPSYRREGIASMLLSALIDFAKENGVISLTLEVRVSNAGAIALYRKFGFQDVGVRRKYYTHPSEDANLMRLEL